MDNKEKYAEAIKDELEKLLDDEWKWKENSCPSKTDTEILGMFLAGCRGHFQPVVIEKIEDNLRNFNGDVWELADAIIPIICNTDNPATAKAVASLVMYIFRKGHPMDLSAVAKPYNLSVARANFSRFRRKHPLLF